MKCTIALLGLWPLLTATSPTLFDSPTGDRSKAFVCTATNLAGDRLTILGEVALTRPTLAGHHEVRSAPRILVSDGHGRPIRAADGLDASRLHFTARIDGNEYNFNGSDDRGNSINVSNAHRSPVAKFVAVGVDAKGRDGYAFFGAGECRFKAVTPAI